MDPPVLVLLGPTGVGKTPLAVELALALGGEVVSADSRQVYRGMDIGTAKPTPAQRAAVPHHLLDVVDPGETFTLAEFHERARAALLEVGGRGLLPMLVGGTGQYLAAVLEGWSVPHIPPQPPFRARLQEEARVHGVESLYRRLQAVDPAAAAHILPRNLRRIIRALEVYEFSGELFSRQRRRERPPFTFFVVGLTMARPALYARVDARAEEMVRQGLLEEVRALLAAGYGWDLPAMSGLGYVQFRPYLEGRASLEEAVARLKYDTHAFIRHQYTWFRRLPVGRWVDAEDGVGMPDLLPLIREWAMEVEGDKGQVASRE